MSNHIASEIYGDSQPSKVNFENGGIQIEKDVPLPAKTNMAQARAAKGPRQPKYPVRRMVPGDSFFLPGYTPKKCNTVVVAGRKAHPKSSWSVRQVDDGCRVWRVS